MTLARIADATRRIGLGPGVLVPSLRHVATQAAAIARSGTVLGPGESWESPRVFVALAPGIALVYHATYEATGAGVDQLPRGRAWREAIERVPAERRHLALHEGHCVAPPARERP